MSVLEKYRKEDTANSTKNEWTQEGIINWKKRLDQVVEDYTNETMETRL